LKPDEKTLQKRFKRFQSATQQAGIKRTHQRLEIFRVVASSSEHPSAEAVYREVKQKMPTVSLDTVYRTLWTFTELGLLNTLGPRQEKVRFDANTERHHHFVCVSCRFVHDIERDVLQDVKIPKSVQNWGAVIHTHVELRGICMNCQRKQEKSVKSHSRLSPTPPKRKKGLNNE